ncbi:hypothetical protein [Butyrivibrio sp. INlla21]|uniref:hypothetical protein n=1 Tax=Butyrivibrio sp. INlla21 TaxID=1520811 RepID=UPI0008E5B962|nr:hypothetical protein [Butyrivibrio sp. INlla21]SFU35656.1 hypothetical protein SAMN02910342_00218 [Butyrivibrio sp. INlla21]
MAFYRCGGKNHYDEGYTAGDAAGYTDGYNQGKAEKRNSGYVDGTYTASNVNEWEKTVTIPNISRVDAIVSASLTDVNGGRHGFAGIYINGTNTVHYDVDGAFSQGWNVSITGRQYHAND